MDREPIADHSLHRRITILTVVAVTLDSFDAALLPFSITSIRDALGMSQSAVAFLMSISVVGYLLGSIGGAMLSTRFGVRPVYIAAALWTGVGTLATSFVVTEIQMMIIRFLVGLGIGVLVPAALAVAANFAPPHRKAGSVILGGIGIPGGIILAGSLGSWVIGTMGWRVLFGIGGIAMFLLMIAIMLVVPRIPHARAPGTPGRAKVGAPLVLRDGLARKTLVLWTAFVLVSVSAWFLVTWLPAMLEATGYSRMESSLMATLFGWGGIGGLVIMTMVSDQALPKALIAAFALAAIAILALPHGAGASTTIALLICGAAATCSQTGIVALTALAYPASLRPAGIGYLLGVGKLGAFLGPVLGGVGLALHLSPVVIYSLAAIPFILLICLIRLAAPLLSNHVLKAARREATAGCQ